MSPWILGAAAGVVLASVGTATYLSARNDALQSSLQHSQEQLRSCAIRLTDIIEDVESDNAIDNLTDDDLRTVPDSWLLPEPSAD